MLAAVQAGARSLSGLQMRTRKRINTNYIERAPSSKNDGTGATRVNEAVMMHVFIDFFLGRYVVLSSAIFYSLALRKYREK